MKSIEENIYWIWLSLLKNIGIKEKYKLLFKYKTPDKLFNISKEELLKPKEFNEKTIEVLCDIEIKNKLQKHIEYMKKNNIKIISIEDTEYPKILKEIYDPPICLYVKGNIEILNNKNIAIIGCREPTDYGIKVTKYFSYNLANNNINIISGLAKGIDAYAHIGAIIAKKTTVAVVGTGLDIIYPKENKIIEEKILENKGAIISEYPLGTKPEKMNFPARNRIISGISQKILVIEAKEKSGTLITVDFALEQGRDVYVVPGNINSINSVGTNNLIKEGARIITNYKEIL